MQKNGDPEQELEKSTEGVASIQPPTSNRGKPNSQLTKEEKQQKRNLKKRVKVQAKIKTLKKRIRHVRGLKKFAVAEGIQKELQALMVKHEDIIQEMSFEDYGNQYNELESEAAPQARSYILEISNRLFHCKAELKGDSSTSKHEEINEGAKLLKHMTRGTQDQSMFQNESALWGYTRQKFVERAFLFCSSVARIGISSDNIDGNAHDNELQNQIGIRNKIWTNIKSGKIRRACSIGCGPGNDAVGLVSFLRLINKEINVTETFLDEILLLDWSIEEWNSSVLSHLRDILIQVKGEKKLVKIVNTAFCDVTKSLHVKSNSDARNRLCACEEEAVHQNKASTRQKSAAIQDQSNYDIFLISYLLSETREKWESFFRELVRLAKSKSMFYFAEPVPWQLHRFIESFKDQLEFIWIDSSMDFPLLQQTERRAGPAVLFAIKK